MSSSDLLKQPVWRAADLGRTIPDSLHAISVALPQWQDVVGYEEKRPAVISRLTGGYPRFVIHPLVRELAGRVTKDQPCLPFPSARVAGLCAAFIRKSGGRAKIEPCGAAYAVVTDAAGAPFLTAFWQHTGNIISSRQAEAVLAGRGDRSDAVDLQHQLRLTLADFYDCAPEDVFLTPTGMAAQHAALRAVMRRSPGQPTAQLGFPYVDTLKLQQKIGNGGILLHDLERIDSQLRELIARQPLAACFAEIPGNPLLGSADLRLVTPLLREHGIPLVADDVVATPFNVDLRPHADLIATSLTKFVAGTCDVMGGAVICNPHSPLHSELHPLLQEAHEELLWGGDAAVLVPQAEGFPERMRRHNHNGLMLAERLRQHPSVERVWYPKWEFSEAYEAVRRADGGWGALITFLPKDAETRSPRVYDSMAVSKGPSLGTVFSLACPFTLLAHYGELGWAESCGIPRNLIRISVGLEDPDELWRRIEPSIRAAASGSPDKP